MPGSGPLQRDMATDGVFTHVEGICGQCFLGRDLASLLGLRVFFLFSTRVGNGATVSRSKGFHGHSASLTASTRSRNSLLELVSEVLWLTAPRLLHWLTAPGLLSPSLHRVASNQTATELGVSVAGAPGTTLILGRDSHNGDGSKG